MGHYVGQFHLIPNSIVGGVSYSKLSESDKLKANLDMANRQILQDEIKKGYVTNLIASERQTQAVLEVAKSQHEMTSAINDMVAGLDIRMAAINEQISFINAGIEGLSNLIKIPNSEKTRIFNITEGMRYLEMALKNPKRYEDALEFLIKAGEANHRDYIINLEIGKIYLYNSSTFDNVKAIDYLVKALEYSELDNPEIGAKVAQHLAFAYYLITDFESAIEMGDLSYDLDNKVLEGLYIAGECRFLLGNHKDGENDMFAICWADKSYVHQVLNNKNIILSYPEDEDWEDFAETLKGTAEDEESKRIIKNEEAFKKSNEFFNMLREAGRLMHDKEYINNYSKVLEYNSITFSMLKNYLEKVIEFKNNPKKYYNISFMQHVNTDDLKVYNAFNKIREKELKLKYEQDKKEIYEKYKYNPEFQLGILLGHIYNYRGEVIIMVIAISLFLSYKSIF